MQRPNTFAARNPASGKFRHIYWSMSSFVPYHFRFSIGSDVFRNPDAFGRPVGVFNADCWGITPQDPSDTRTKVKISEDPNTAARFPLATAFTTREQAAVECDFWKLVLRRKYYLEIPWSHPTYDAFLCAAGAAQRSPLTELEDETTWSHELVDFIAQHLPKLLEHRDAHKPDVDLDQWMKIAKATNNIPLRSWVECVLEAQSDLEKFQSSIPEKTISKLTKLAKRLDVDPISGTTNRDFSGQIKQLNEQIESARTLCNSLLTQLHNTSATLNHNLDKQLSDRPPIF